MIKTMSTLSPTLLAIAVVWPFAGANAGSPAEPGQPGRAEERNSAAGGVPLIDSIDDNFNPVSMADLIDGRPLVLAVSSCT